jgi:hypothetical protein
MKARVQVQNKSLVVNLKGFGGKMPVVLILTMLIPLSLQGNFSVNIFLEAPFSMRPVSYQRKVGD